MSVAMHIIKLNNFIIQIDTKQNYVSLLRIVNMVNIVHSLMVKMNLS